MTDTATVWFEIVQYNDRKLYTIAKTAYQEWLCRHPRPPIITYDDGNEFLGHPFKNSLFKNITELIPSVKIWKIWKQIQYYKINYQFITNLVCKFYLLNKYLDEDDPWLCILADTDFVVGRTYHTTLQVTPGQLVLGCDMILKFSFTTGYLLGHV